MKKIVWLLSGFKSSGKDTTSNVIKEIFPDAKEYAFAEKIKKICSIVFNVPYDIMEGKTVEARRKREELIPFWSDHIPNLTSRKALNCVGTQLFRENFYDNIWVMSTINQIITDQPSMSIVTDLREPHEESISKKLLSQYDFDVISVRIVRDDPEWLDIARKAWYENCQESIEKLNTLDVHSSEWRQVGLNPDFYLSNDKYNYQENLKNQMLRIIKNLNIH